MNANNLVYQQNRDESQEALMRESWARDDNAVQRRANDLSTAGLSPLLAAGAAASNSAVANLQGQSQKAAPQTDYSAVMDGLIKGVSAYKTLGDLRNQTVQTGILTDKNNRDQSIFDWLANKGGDPADNYWYHQKNLENNKKLKTWFESQSANADYTNKVRDSRINAKLGLRVGESRDASARARLIGKQADMVYLNSISQGIGNIQSLIRSLFGGKGGGTGKIGF